MGLQRRATAAPILVGPSENWRGNDGQWSTLPLRLGAGKQTQDVEVLVSTVTTFPIVISASQGCPTGSQIPNCNGTRGSTYVAGQSSTWNGNSSVAPFLQIEQNLGLNTNSIVGTEDVGLGWQLSPSATPTVNNTVIAQVADPRYWLGLVGVNPRPTNATDNFNDPQTALLSALKDQSSIPSVSYGYGEGAMYRSPSCFTQLTLGGYDQAQMESAGVSLAMQPATARDLVVGIRSITVPSLSNPSSSTEILASPVNNVFVDSTFPFIWLPQAACANFESAFGLVWNETWSLYLLSDAQHQRLQAANPSVSFMITKSYGNSTDAATNITLPYAAFDLQASYPLISNDNPQVKPMRYFPLKRAANESQYTLGRVFMQEAYLVADYERYNFTVAPRTATLNPPPSLVPIYPQRSSELSAEPGNGPSGLSGGAIAGIVIGVILGLAGLIAIALLYVLRKRRRASKVAELEAKTGKSPEVPDGHSDEIFAKAELPAPNDPGHTDFFATEKKHYAEAPAEEQPRFELEAPGVAEMPSPPLPQEMPSPPMRQEMPVPNSQQAAVFLSPRESEASSRSQGEGEENEPTGLSPVPEEQTLESLAAREGW